MDDLAVEECAATEPKTLSDLFEKPGHRLLFLREFRIRKKANTTDGHNESAGDTGSPNTNNPNQSGIMLNPYDDNTRIVLHPSSPSPPPADTSFQYSDPRAARKNALQKSLSHSTSKPKLLEKLKAEFSNSKTEKINSEKKNMSMSSSRPQPEEMMLKIKEAMSNARDLYKSSMENALRGPDPLVDSALQARHEQAERKSLQEMDIVLQDYKTYLQGTSVTKSSLMAELTRDFTQSREMFENKNLEKWSGFESRVRSSMQDALKVYMRDMKTFTERCVEKTELRKANERFHGQALDVFRRAVGQELGESPKVKTLQKEFEASLQMQGNVCEDLLILKLKEDALAVEGALIQTRKYYTEQMEKHTKSRNWIEVAELERIHQKTLTTAIQEYMNDEELSSQQEKALRKALGVVYLKYEEDNRRRQPHQEPAIGIDLGTTYSCVGVYVNGEVKMIPNMNLNESTTMPSCVAFNSDRTITVGTPAKDAIFIQPEHTVYDAKRLIGRKFTDPIVQKDMELWPFTVVGDPENEPRISVRGREFRPEEISSKVLAKLKQNAELYLQTSVRKAVVTVPAYFGDAQRQATKDAAAIAGLDATILNEPTAAAMAYQLHRTGDLARKIVVFDLGGGTFDVAVLEITEGELKVLSVNGDTHLGGDDFDAAMVDYLVERIKSRGERDLAEDSKTTNPMRRLKAVNRLRRLRTACEEHKRNLSVSHLAKIVVESLDGYNFNETLTRAEFNQINETKFQTCIEILRKALQDAKLKKEQVDDIVLVGGSTKIPRVQQLLKEFFDGKKALNQTINADEAVAWGAAYQAALLNRGQVDQGQQLQVRDVTPMSLGINIKGGYTSVVVPRNTHVPCTRSSPFCTTEDYQQKVTFPIYEGEDRMSINNTLLGSFTVSDLPRRLAEDVTFTATMVIDKEGILHVKAICTETGVEEGVKIDTYKGRMSGHEIKLARSQSIFRW